MAKKKQQKLTVNITYRLTQFYFRTLGSLLPELSGRLGLYLWGKTRRPAWRPWEIEILQQARSSQLKVGDHRIATYHWGDSGKMILLAHGWDSRASHFRNYIRELLKQGYQVVGFDAIGHGHSSGGWTNIIQYCQVLNAVNLHYGPFHTAIGHSFGGFVLPRAIVEGLQCERAVIISSPDTMLWLFERFVRTLDMTPNTHQAMYTRVTALLGEDGWEQYSVAENARQLGDIPALILIDSDDPAIEIEAAQNIQQSWPNAQLHITHGLGHQKVLRHSNAIQPVLEFIGATK